MAEFIPVGVPALTGLFTDISEAHFEFFKPFSQMDMAFMELIDGIHIKIFDKD